MCISNLCIDIKKYFLDKKTDFGENLFNEVNNKTNNFSNNLTFFELKNKINDDYLDFMLYFYCLQNKNLFFIIVWPITYNFDKIIKDCYGKYGNIIYKKEIEIKYNGVNNILHFISDKSKHPKGKELWFAEPHSNKNPLTIYLFETKEINIDENEKYDYLVKIFNDNEKFIQNFKENEGLNNLYCTTKAKRECRELLKKNNCVSPIEFAPDKNYSHHVNDSHKETIELSRIFFNENSILALNYCNIDYKCDSFNDKYKKYFNFINNNKWGNINDFCLNNSSILSQFGLRQSRDIDYLHNVDFDINKQIPEEEISSHNYVVKEMDRNININELIYNPSNYFWYKNIKFLTLNSFLKYKQIQRYKQYNEDKTNFLKNINNNKVCNDISLVSNLLSKIHILENYNINIDMVKVDKKLERKNTCHYRMLYLINNYWYKVIIFDDTIDTKYIKELNYFENLKKAIEVNFYEKISYYPIFKIDEKRIISYSIKNLNKITDIDNYKYLELIKNVANKSKKYELILTDIHKDNIVEFNNKYYLIDLETLIEEKNYKKYLNVHYHRNIEYEECLNIENKKNIFNKILVNNKEKLKVLHLSFHKGCQNDIEYIAKKLNFNLTFMEYDDGISIGLEKYNVTHEKAISSWNKYKDYYNSFDIIITSDTAPISRIFLQNNFKKRLIIWICNRFDYANQPSLNFPDQEYYDLINSVKDRPNVHIIGYTPFENYYANNIRKLSIGNECIKPIGKIGKVYNNYVSTQIKDKKNTFIIGPYHNDNLMIDLKSKVSSLGIKVYNGRYDGPKDLAEFAGIIHIPYAWSNIALFEAIQYQIIFFIPSLNFLKYFINTNIDGNKKNSFFWSPPLIENVLYLSEWYCEDFKNIFIYFDSWDDLKYKINSLDFNNHKKLLKNIAKEHKYNMLFKWKEIIFI